MMERLIDTYGKKVTKILTKQYRMNETIMNWVSEKTYQGILKADDSVAKQTLADFAHVERNSITEEALILIDTTKCKMWEHQSQQSKGNHGEVEVAKAHIVNLIEAGVKQKEIAVITPYKLQESLIKLRIEDSFPHIEVKTIDNFQGREKETIIISMVRSNDKNKIGFLEDVRRLNVAVTRARRHLVLIGNLSTGEESDYIKELKEYTKKQGKILTLE